MFEQAIVDGARRSSPWSFAASITMQSVLVGAALLLPVMHVAQINTRPPDILFLPRTLGAPEPVKQVPARSGSASSSAILNAGRAYRVFHAPARIPEHVAMGPDLPNAPVYLIGGGSGGTASIGLPGRIPGLDSQELPVPAPPPPKPQPAMKRTELVRVGGTVQAAKLVYGPKPLYPPLAKQARITGAVRLVALISADGHIRDLRLTSGHPMLATAAIQAVSQWVYQPTLLNGLAVEVLTDIEVNFVLQ